MPDAVRACRLATLQVPPRILRSWSNSAPLTISVLETSTYKLRLRLSRAVHLSGMSYSALFPTPRNPGADSPGSSVFDLPTQPGQPQATPYRGPSPATGQATDPSQRSAGETSFVVISGGTGCNSICSAFGHSACYILPVSDDGGSSSEVIRVLGGPSIGESPLSENKLLADEVCTQVIFAPGWSV